MITWQPTAPISNLKQRAKVIAKIRNFFAERDVLEVETHLLSHAAVTDIHLQSFVTDYYSAPNSTSQKLYLQTSPEFAMKRLLAAGSGSIYQICKAFRNEGESGRMHNPEFTLLEWYRVGFDHQQLMNEMDDFLQLVLQCLPAEKISYADLFLKYVNLNPHLTNAAELKNSALQLGLEELKNIDTTDKDIWLQLLMSHYIEPKLGINAPTFVYDFPVTQAALARIRNDNPPVAERFEVYFKGIELANGFHELTNAQEQQARFENDLRQRKELNYAAGPMDHNLLAALQHGLPACAGVALGIDRLVMLATQTENITDVISFPLEIA